MKSSRRNRGRKISERKEWVKSEGTADSALESTHFSHQEVTSMEVRAVILKGEQRCVRGQVPALD